jgi:hypothetical protein
MNVSIKSMWILTCIPTETGIAQAVWRLSTGWTTRGPNTGGRRDFATCPHRVWGPPSLLYNGYRVSFPGVKRPGCGVNHTPPSGVEVQKSVQLYVYSTSGLSWLVTGRTLPLPLHVPDMHCTQADRRHDVQRCSWKQTRKHKKSQFHGASISYKTIQTSDAISSLRR